MTSRTFHVSRNAVFGLRLKRTRQEIMGFGSKQRLISAANYN